MALEPGTQLGAKARNAEAMQMIRGALDTASLTSSGPASSSSILTQYRNVGHENDGFYTVGTAQYRVRGTSELGEAAADGSRLLTVQYRYEFYDDYNWHRGLQVTIGQWNIEDTTLGMLHEQGVAREFRVRGKGSWQQAQFRVSPEGEIVALDGFAFELSGGAPEAASDNGESHSGEVSIDD